MRFQTSDGYVFSREGDTWTDGDLTFDSAPDGWPVDSNGERLEGRYLADNSGSE